MVKCILILLILADVIVSAEFGAVALVHSLLKVAGIRQLFSRGKRGTIKTGEEKRLVFLHLFHLRDLLDSPSI